MCVRAIWWVWARPGNNGQASQSNMPAQTRSKRVRGFCFTLNNYTPEDEEYLQELQCQYLVYGKEEAPTTGTKHLQGYIHFQREKTIQAVRNLMKRCHVEKRMGTLQQAIDYCKKDGEYHEQGEIQTKSLGDQWKQIIQYAKEGRMEEIEDHYPRQYLQYYKTLMSIQAFNSKPIDGELEHEWWYGPTGTGKSRTVWEKYPKHYQKPVNKWWDGYSGQDIVVIEEWEPKNEMTASKLKIWADRYPFSGEIKGGTLQMIRPKKIIVTSNYTIQECFPNEQDHKPLQRRFKVKHFPGIFASLTEPQFITETALISEDFDSLQELLQEDSTLNLTLLGEGV